jgi:DNA-binding MarR family transcriptional regulator
MKEQCPEDRRGAHAVLTERGAKALKDTWEVHGSAVAQLLGSLYSGAEARTLHDLLVRLIEGERGASLVDVSRR